MALDSYNNLKAEIAEWLDRDDLTGRIDTFIDIAEARHQREIRIREMITSADLTLSEDARTVSLPNDFLDSNYLRVLVPNATSGRKFFPDVEELSTHELTQKAILDAKRPHYFTIHESIEFDAPADQAYTLEFFYYKALTALSDSNATNALLTRAGDVYLYGALSASAPFLMNDERVPLWESLYVAARDGLNLSQIKSRRGGPLVSRVSGSTP